MKVGLTGHTGLLGWHLRCRLSIEPDVEIVTAGREELSDEDLLERFVEGCDVVVHFAGMNRGDDAELEKVNLGLATALVEAMERSRGRPHLIFSSSTHIDRDTAYGRSKRAAAERFREWANRSGARFTNLILPHVFGEDGRPFHNSVVSTFCHELAAGRVPTIDRDGDLELLHAGEVAELCVEIIRNDAPDELRPSGREMSVSGLLELLSSMSRTYASDVIPAFADRFDLRMFNTFRSYLFPDFYPRSLNLNTDQRGSLFEAVKTRHGGQAFLSTTKPGVTRGQHFHFAKIERFLVVQGEAIIRLRRMFGEVITEFRVSGDAPEFVDMPTLYVHDITNIGQDQLLTLFWTHEIFDPRATDTYAQPVKAAEGAR